MKHPSENRAQQVLAGLVERVTYHNVENGFCVLLDAGKVVGVISIGDVVKDIIRNLEHNVGDLMGYIMTDGPGG